MSIFNVWDAYMGLLKEKTSQVYFLWYSLLQADFHFANLAVIADLPI